MVSRGSGPFFTHFVLTVCYFYSSLKSSLGGSLSHLKFVMVRVVRGLNPSTALAWKVDESVRSGWLQNDYQFPSDDELA